MPQPRERSSMRPADALRGHCRRRGVWNASAALVALVGVAILVAGCGSGSSLGVANIASSGRSGHHLSSPRAGGGGVFFAGVAVSPAQRAANGVAALLFSRCMRAHGVPDFPDPRPASLGFGFGLGGGGSGIDFAAPLFQAAQRICISILIHRRAGPG